MAAVKFMSSVTLYCLVQCTLELSVSLCLTVLESAIGSLPMCCTGKQGGTVVLSSSNIRYGTLPIFLLHGIIYSTSSSASRKK
ncbi:hypothetical protein SO802_007584 [Lithocarpus litseifolius]|uniref:Gnk2-homologous domain-containing protein n=1 Tax=Lithocarpus litseifolius TaxID=425828 RepID=A0AAW2DPX0_9ROSI